MDPRWMLLWLVVLAFVFFLVRDLLTWYLKITNILRALEELTQVNRQTNQDLKKVVGLQTEQANQLRTIAALLAAMQGPHDDTPDNSGQGTQLVGDARLEE